jgi:hypothetical protein
LSFFVYFFFAFLEQPLLKFTRHVAWYVNVS